MWQFCISELSKKNRIVAIDLLGHGKSDCLGYIHTMENQSEMIDGVMNYLKIENASMVGHSMGGYVALAFAELFPKKINSLVLINSTAYEDSPERKKNRERAVTMVKKDYTSFVKLAIANLFSENSRLTLNNEVEKVKIEALKTPLQGIIAAQEGMKIRKERINLLHSLKVPKMLILSQKDPVLDYQENVKQVENTSVQLVTFADGHMSHIENRQELLSVLLKFFK